MGDEKPLEGRTALIEVAGRGIGRSVGAASAEAGARVWCLSRSEATATRPDTVRIPVLPIERA